MSKGTKPALVTDSMFERAVDADIAGLATPADSAMLEADPLTWRGCLVARQHHITALLGGNPSTTWREVLVEQRGEPMYTFRVRTREMDRPALLRLLAKIVGRIQRAKIVQREVAQDESGAVVAPAAYDRLPAKARFKMRARAAEALLLRALDILADVDDEDGDVAAIRADVAAYVASYRGGFALGSDSLDDVVEAK